ncbi:MAG: hypothetical protein ACYCST_15455 [Acidimicrobiales bacterium]
MILYPPVGRKSTLPSVEIDTTAATTLRNEGIGDTDTAAPPFGQPCRHLAADAGHPHSPGAPGVFTTITPSPVTARTDATKLAMTSPR